MSMELVQNFNDIKINMTILDEYLGQKTDPEYSYALNLVRRGTCFIAVLGKDGYRFYPSRFIGYKDNTMERHENNYEKDGKVTNPQISNILDKKLQLSNMLNIEYKKYCESLGFVAWEKGSFGVERKFWVVD